MTSMLPNYMYDNEGKRTVKQHGGNEAVYTNSAEAGVRTEAPHYSLYANPYFVMNDGDKYTEHIYIGSERIAVRVAKLSDESSVLGNFNEEDMAGQSIVTGGIDYGAKREAQEQVIAACYDSLQYVYRPVDRRSLVNISMVPSDADTSDADDSDDERGTANPDTEWKKVYYYCTDHIGSTRLVLDDSARIAERLMFLPTGEVFMDEQNSTLYHSDFLFSGKELDAETGNYYYGARYYAPRIGIWLSPDPLQLKYPHVSSYAYCAGNPLTFIDLWGKEKLNAFNLKGESEKLGTELYITPLSDDPNSIILFAHGSMNGFRAFGKGLPDVGQVINTVEGFEEYLTSHSHIWNERYVKDNKISVVLFVCESGKDQPGHDSFAKQFSKAHPEISVFAPNDEAIIYKDGSARVKNNNNWLEYSNGTIVGKYHSGAEPGTVKFKNTTIWNKMNNNNDKYTVPWQQDQ